MECYRSCRAWLLAGEVEALLMLLMQPQVSGS